MLLSGLFYLILRWRTTLGNFGNLGPFRRAARYFFIATLTLIQVLLFQNCLGPKNSAPVSKGSSDVQTLIASPYSIIVNSLGGSFHDVLKFQKPVAWTDVVIGISSNPTQ